MTQPSTLYFGDNLDILRDHITDKKIIVSVKGGETVNVSMVRDLAHVVERENAVLGFFVTLASPTKPMLTEAASAGLYQSPAHGAFPKIQILTIQDLLNGKKPEYIDLSHGATGSKQAKIEKGKSKQGKLL